MNDLRKLHAQMLSTYSILRSATPKGSFPPRLFHRLRKLRALSLAHVRAASAWSASAAAVGQTLPGVDKDLGQEGFAFKAIFSSIHKNS